MIIKKNRALSGESTSISKFAQDNLYDCSTQAVTSPYQCFGDSTLVNLKNPMFSGEVGCFIQNQYQLNSQVNTLAVYQTSVKFHYVSHLTPFSR